MGVVSIRQAALVAASWFPKVPTPLWINTKTYQLGEQVIDRGGLWLCVVEEGTASRPVSGNTDWSLVGGTPYVDVVLDPVALTTAPFYDPTSTGPGVVAIPAPGVGLMIQVLRSLSTISAGDAWGVAANAALAYGDAAGTTPLFTNVSDSLDHTADEPSPPPWWWADTTESSPGGNNVDADIADLPIVVFTTNDVTDGGSTVGTSSLLLRFYYVILPALASSPSTFFHITAVNQGTKTVDVSPDPTSAILPGDIVTWVGNTGGNNGTYTVASLDATTITFTQAIPDSVADGWIKKGA